jgi:hypothetical protein
MSLYFIPLPHISIRVNVNNNQFENVGTEFETKQVTLYTIQGRFALNPRLQLTGLYQRNTQNNLDSYNIRLAWEYQPLSYVYLVLNSRETLGVEPLSKQVEQQGIFKISYLKQF